MYGRISFFMILQKLKLCALIPLLLGKFQVYYIFKTDFFLYLCMNENTIHLLENTDVKNILMYYLFIKTKMQRKIFKTMKFLNRMK